MLMTNAWELLLKAKWLQERGEVEGHDGRITIESSQDVRDHGTKVDIFLPV